jgi:hypothetical protein
MNLSLLAQAWRAKEPDPDDNTTPDERQMARDVYSQCADELEAALAQQAQPLTECDGYCGPDDYHAPHCHTRKAQQAQPETPTREHIEALRSYIIKTYVLSDDEAETRVRAWTGGEYERFFMAGWEAACAACGLQKLGFSSTSTRRAISNASVGPRNRDGALPGRRLSQTW